MPIQNSREMSGRPLGLKEAASSFAWENEHRLMHALELTSVGLVMTDAKLKIQHINGVAKDMMPLCRELLRPGKSFLEAAELAIRKGDWETDDKFAEAWLKQAIAYRVEPKTIALRGLRWARLEAKKTCENGLVITMSDVTEYRKRMEWLTEIHDRLAGEGEDLKLFARRLAQAKTDATDALRRAKIANAALAREISERRALEKELRRIANTDGLTGVTNRRRFIEILEREVERARRYNRPLVLLMLDLDHFKRINDHFGHSAGDEALRHFSRVCCDNLREIDTFARLGGEEFAALLPETNHNGGLDVAQRLRSATQNLEFHYGGQAIRVTVSIGLASLDNEHVAPSVMLSKADRALYAAKLDGRDRVAHIMGQNDPIIDRHRLIESVAEH